MYNDPSMEAPPVVAQPGGYGMFNQEVAPGSQPGKKGI